MVGSNKLRERAGARINFNQRKIFRGEPRADTLGVPQAPMMNFFPFAQIETISPRPLLFIVGERAVSAYFSEDAYGKAAGPKNNQWRLP